MISAGEQFEFFARCVGKVSPLFVEIGGSLRRDHLGGRWPRKRMPSEEGSVKRHPLRWMAWRSKNHVDV